MLVKRLVVFAVIAVLPAFAQANFTKFSGQLVCDHSSLIGAHMSHANFGGFHADYCNLSRADLSNANLSHAVLNHSDLSRADLNHANLSRAVLNQSDLNHANLSGAELSGADLRTVENLAPKVVKAATNWDRAFYDDRMLKALRLPADHNARLAEQLKTEEELQKRQNAEQPAPKPSTPQ